MNASRAVAFADLDGGVWGAAWVARPDEQGTVALRRGADTAFTSAALAGDGVTEPWWLEGEGVELSLSPSGEAVRSAAQVGGIDGFDQLCQVSGTVALGAGAQDVACLGWRSERGPLELDRIESFREVAAWFAPREGLALLALRPRDARGHESDVIAAVVLEGAQGVPVSDPRMSTTYTAAGLPARVGLELWVEEEPLAPDAPDDAAPEQFPRRAAAEAVGEGLGWENAGFALQAVPLLWHSRGRDGAGVYLLGRRH
jgi:hypothetical protein